MPDPISSSSVMPGASTAICGEGDDPSLTCQAPVQPTSASGANSCELPAEPSAPATNASSGLVQKFSNNDHRAFIAASAPPSAPPPSIAAPSGPPVATVRSGQIDLQTGIPQGVDRGTIGDLHVTARGDLLNAGAHVGSLNEDGSHGANVGAGVNLLNGEVDLDYKGYSFALGLGASLGGSISSGEGRDLDGDGIPERCFKMTLGPLTLGECDEL